MLETIKYDKVDPDNIDQNHVINK